MSNDNTVQQAAMFARKHVKSRTAGDGAYGEGEDCVALDLLDQLADLIESLARSEAEARADNAKLLDVMRRCADADALTVKERDEARAESAAHKVDAERLSWLDRDDIELDCSTRMDSPIVLIFHRKSGKLLGEGQTIRDAIDAAMKASNA